MADARNPFLRDNDAPVSPLLEAWARTLCTVSQLGGDPDQLIGNPRAPRWRSWVGYAEFAMAGALALGYAGEVGQILQIELVGHRRPLPGASFRRCANGHQPLPRRA